MEMAWFCSSACWDKLWSSSMANSSWNSSFFHIATCSSDMLKNQLASVLLSQEWPRICMAWPQSRVIRVRCLNMSEIVLEPKGNQELGVGVDDAPRVAGVKGPISTTSWHDLAPDSCDPCFVSSSSAFPHSPQRDGDIQVWWHIDTIWYIWWHCAPGGHSSTATPALVSSAAAFHCPQVLSARASARASSKSSASTSTSPACQQVFLKKLPGLGFKMRDRLEIKASLDGPWWHQAPSSITVEDSRWLTLHIATLCNTRILPRLGPALRAPIFGPTPSPLNLPGIWKWSVTLTRLWPFWHLSRFNDLCYCYS